MRYTRAELEALGGAPSWEAQVLRWAEVHAALAAAGFSGDYDGLLATEEPVKRRERKASGGGRKAAAQLFSEKVPSFQDVAGAYQAKLKLQEMVDFLRNANKYKSLGAKIPMGKGFLLVVLPETGRCCSHALSRGGQGAVLHPVSEGRRALHQRGYVKGERTVGRSRPSTSGTTVS
ncbi:hypothetical protein QYE76_061066 [Lolium multiflorum]|uniref:Uncharacterized protein n=1 Tax=Lolium multiflorum TaxID=4521 RepID=A0AAD8W4C6_LOLMU|nr:hypothetical protein QYE76_061066 [Lolium multiflorum]